MATNNNEIVESIEATHTQERKFENWKLSVVFKTKNGVLTEPKEVKISATDDKKVMSASINEYNNNQLSCSFNPASSVDGALIEECYRVYNELIRSYGTQEGA